MAGETAEVWWLATDSLGAGDWPELEALLDEAERARAARFHFERDRLSYVAAHALGRRLLSARAGGEPSAWAFTVGPHGKPEVRDAPRLRLNLSHTRGLAAAVLAEEHDVGIDVEWLGRPAAGPELAPRFFAPTECDILALAPPERAEETFLAFWTLKEAYIKAIGLGLAQPLDSFAFTLEPLSISFAPGIADNPARWHFARFRPTPAHLMALALRHPAPHTVTTAVTEADMALLCAQPGRMSRR